MSTEEELRKLLLGLLEMLEEKDKQAQPVMGAMYQPVINTNSIVTIPKEQPKQPKVTPLRKVELMQRLEKANAAKTAKKTAALKLSEQRSANLAKARRAKRKKNR